MTNTLPDCLQPWNKTCDDWLLNQATNLDQLFSEDTETQENRDEEKHIADIALNGFISTVTLMGAIEIGLFDALAAKPYQLEALTQQLNVPKGHLTQLLAMLKRLSLVEIKSKEWTLQTSARRFFTPTAPEFEPYFWTRLAMTRLFLQKYMTGWADIIRGQREFDELQWPPRNEQESRDFEYIMTAEAPYIVAQIKPLIQKKPTKRLLDVGGGNGTIASLLASQQSDLQVDVLNLPHVAPLITETAKKFNVAERVKAVEIDFLEEPFPKDYDVILFSRVLVDWPDNVASKLLSKARQALNSTGRLIICEPMGGPTEGTSRFWLTFMTTVVNAPAFARNPLKHIDLLNRNGFHHLQLHSNGFYESYGVIQANINPESDEEIAQILQPSKSVYQNGDTVQVFVPPSLEEQVQYLGIKIPGGQMFLLNQRNGFQPFDEVKLSVWGGDQIAVEQIVMPKIPRGKYLLYLLCTPEGEEPLAYSGQWTLNVSMFRVQ
jgi:demethylspheroidene O-methyltransferase